MGLKLVVESASSHWHNQNWQVTIFLNVCHVQLAYNRAIRIPGFTRVHFQVCDQFPVFQSTFLYSYTSIARFKLHTNFVHIVHSPNFKVQECQSFTFTQYLDKCSPCHWCSEVCFFALARTVGQRGKDKLGDTERGSRRVRQLFSPCRRPSCSLSSYLLLMR